MICQAFRALPRWRGKTWEHCSILYVIVCSSLLSLYLAIISHSPRWPRWSQAPLMMPSGPPEKPLFSVFIAVSIASPIGDNRAAWIHVVLCMSGRSATEHHERGNEEGFTCGRDLHEVRSCTYRCGSVATSRKSPNTFKEASSARV